MLVRMRTTLAGPEHCCPAGQAIALSDTFARMLIKKGYAERVEAPSPPAKAEPEAAALETPETAVEKPAKPRRRK